MLASVDIPATRSAGDHKGERVPQMWTYEHSLSGRPTARSFVWMQGHTYANIADYQIEHTLRAIAWAAKKPINELIDYVPPSRPARGTTAPQTTR